MPGGISSGVFWQRGVINPGNDVFRPAVIGAACVRETLTPAVLARGAAHRSALLQDIVVCRFTEIDVGRQIKAGSQDFEPGLTS